MDIKPFTHDLWGELLEFDFNKKVVLNYFMGKNDLK